MTLAVFNFPYHTVETQNPESGVRGQFGGSYVFTTPPTDPDQRLFTLKFAAMQFFVDGAGVPEAISNPTYNMLTLINFYLAHKLYLSFTYAHPVHGTLEVKFQKSLVEPEGIAGGFGVTKEVTVELIEVP